MKIRTSLIAAASALALVAALAAPAGAATPPTNVANDTIDCHSIVGTLKFVPTLTSGGTMTGHTTVKAALTDCATTGLSNTGTTATTIISGSAAGTITSSTNDCAGLSGLSTASSGNLITKWKTLSGAPKITPTASTLAVTQTNGTDFSTDSWNGDYGEFQIGTAYGTTAPTVTGAFTGGHTNRAATDATVGQTITGAAIQCLLLGGIKALNFGIGGSALGTNTMF